MAISYVEAQDLAELVASLPVERQTVIRGRFADALSQLEAAGVVSPKESPGGRAMLAPDDHPSNIHDVARRYFQEQIPCPFLENESCSIHPRRPLVCREYHVTSPAENCRRLYEVGVERLHPPLHMGEVMARTVQKAIGASLEMIPLVLSLEWSEEHSKQLYEPRDGMDLFRTMIGEIDTEYAQPFGRRESGPSAPETKAKDG